MSNCRWAFALFATAGCRPAPLPGPPEPLPRVDAAMLEPPALATGPEPVPEEPSTELRPNCQAPLAAYAEISRALTHAGLRSTASSACVDGPGTRVVVDSVEVCPAASTGSGRVFDVGFVMTEYTEGGRRGCGADCPPLPVERTSQRWTATFEPVANGHRLVLPQSMLSLPNMTPWDQVHDGKCYGPLPAYPERTVNLGR